METAKEILEQAGNLERYPKFKLEKLGESSIIKLLDEGTFVSAEVIQSAFKEKGIKGIKARDSLVFKVLDGQETKEFWVSRTNYTNIRQLADIRKANKNNLVDVLVKVEKVSENDPAKSTLEITKA